MAGADEGSAAWAPPLARLLAGQAAAALEMLSLITAEISAQAGDAPEGEDPTWLRSAERLEALWRRFAEDHSEAFVAAWPDIQRELTSLLPLLSRMQPLFAMLVQLLPLLAGPQVLGRAIESGGTNLAKVLEQLLADPARVADSQTDEEPAGDSA